MIDTIVLTIPQDKFKILNHARFTPSTEGLFMPPYYRLGGRGNFTCKQNPTKTELKKGFYRPRLTVSKRIREGGFEVNMRIELSLPKLFFGNNFNELEDQNFLKVVRLLSRKLYEMDVIVSFEDLENAQVSAIHYSKNIHLTDYSTCSMVLNELRKLDLTKRIDLGEEKFRNGGHALHYHTNSFEIVFYDKVKDLEQAKVSEKRAIEKDNTMQMGLFDTLNIPRKREIFRMEVRLGNRTKIKTLFQTLGMERPLTFQDCFKKEVAQKVLLHYWENVEEKNSQLNFDTRNTCEFFESLLVCNPEIKPKKLLELFACVILGKEGGTRRLRVNLGYDRPKERRKWYDLKKRLKTLRYSKDGNYRALRGISESLNDFEVINFSVENSI